MTKDYEETYWDANYTTYLLLKDRNAIQSLQGKLPAFMQKEMAGSYATVNFYLEPFSSIHLYSAYGGFEPNNSITYIYILGAVGLIILIIACSTYINLTTARSIERAKEVGVKKVLGAANKQLFWQFLTESAVLCMMAMVLSFIAAIFMMPWFNQLTEKQLQVCSLFSLPFILFSLISVAIVSFLAGSYPALIMTWFKPIKVLKGSFRNTGSGHWLRKSLIVFQFTISVFLIVSTFTMQKQLRYIQHKKLGYSREHVLVLPMDKKMLASLPLIKQQFKLNPAVISVSRCMQSPVEGGGGYNMRSATMPDNEQLAVTANPFDEDYIKTTGLQLIAGEDFSGQEVKDVSDYANIKKMYHFILNESAAKQLGWTAQSAVGKKMFLDNSRPGFVKGVVKDFNFESLHNSIKPFVLFPEVRAKELLVKLNVQSVQQTISFLQIKWKTLFPDRPFEYRFMEEDYNKLYGAELRLGKVMNLFSVIAIVLACLGLFGLSAYTSQQRTKEIGVRKVLGASVGNIITILSKDFIKLAAIAIVVSFPVAWLSDSKNYHTLLQKIETIWHSDLPAIPFEYSFLDDEVQKQYEKEITLSRIINSFTLIAILISCLGLFGLASFSAEQKKKEIGIRKVLGASVSGIVRLLSKDFIKLVIVSFVIATPVAWWAMDKWLQNFAYRISVTWWMFAIAGPTAIFVTLLTVSFQAIKAAIANPVKSLRTE